MNRAPAPQSPPPYASSANPPPLNGDDNENSRGLGGLFGNHPHSPPVNQHTRPTGPGLVHDGRLWIHAACFCDQDITQKIRHMVTPQQTLSIHCDALTYNFGDPWPNHIKQFSLIYSYDQQPWQVIASVEGPEVINLHPSHQVEHARMQFIQPPTNKVVAVVWGTQNALVDVNGRSADTKIMEIEREGRIEASNGWMGFDGNQNVEKMAVVYYRHSNGNGVGVLTAREGEDLRLPWNTFGGAI